MPAPPPWKKLVRELSDAGYESPYLDRLRQRIDPSYAHEQLEKEILREMAESLGRAGDRVSYALLRLELLDKEIEAATDPAARAELISRFNTLRREAWTARHELRIQREAVGFRRNAILETIYPLPPRRE